MPCPPIIETWIVISCFLSLVRSSMFFDEDGHLAHEFYEECQVHSEYGVRWSMKRIYNKLVPQV